MPPRWTQVEVDFLDQMAGNIPRCKLPQRYNCWAASAGFPQRSAAGIETKLSKLSISSRAIGDMITTSLIAQILGVHITSVRKWCRNPQLLPAVRCGGWWYVRRRDLVAFAKRRPDLFHRFPVPRLVMLLEDQRLAESIVAGCHSSSGVPRRVVAVETGRIYPSLAAAARSVGASHGRVRRSIRDGHAVGGYRWRWYDQKATPPQSNGRGYPRLR